MIVPIKAIGCAVNISATPTKVNFESFNTSTSSALIITIVIQINPIVSMSIEGLD